MHGCYGLSTSSSQAKALCLLMVSHSSDALNFKIHFSTFVFLNCIPHKIGLSQQLSGKESACQRRRCHRDQFNLWFRKNPWRRKWQPTLVFQLGKSMDTGAWKTTVHGVAELDATEHARTCTRTHMHTHAHPVKSGQS